MELKQLFLSIEVKNNLSLPSVLLLDEGIPGLDALEFCQWMQSRPQSIPVVLLTNHLNERITLTERQYRQEKGAFDVLPPFSEGAIAIEAVNALKCVVAAFGDVETSNNALVSCIMDLKRAFEAESKPSPPPTITPSIAQNPATVTPTASPTELKKDKVRKYRGRDY
jgi:CheY-like chemotaxis protein